MTCKHLDKCGYEVTDKQYIAARFDYPCPRCNQSILSRFHLRKRETRDMGAFES